MLFVKNNTRPVRMRTKFDLRPHLVWGFYGSFPTEVTSVNGWRHYTWMMDQINPKSGARRPDGVCQHLKVDSTFVASTFSYINEPGHDNTVVTAYNWVDQNYAAGAGLSPTGNAVIPYDKGYSNLVDSFLTTSTFENLCVAAFTKQITQVPAKISLLNFLFELKDFRELGKSLSKIPQALRKDTLARDVKLTAKYGKKLPLAVAKASSDTFLSWNFQWAPFIGDLQTLSRVGTDAARRLDYLIKTNKKSVTVHYEKKDCYTHPNVGGEIFRNVFAGNDQYYILRDHVVDFESTWNLFHNLHDLQDAYSGIRATLATLGVNNPLKAVWNAIPFSFMVDWVLPLGNWLEKAAVQPFTGEWVISGVSCSVHEVSTIDFYVDCSKVGGLGPSLQQTVVVDKYTRFDGLPFTLGAFDFSQLTDTQQKLAAAIPLGKILGKAL